MKEDKMGRACSTYEGGREMKQYFGIKMEYEGYLDSTGSG
jgi:hypothetical protein